MSALPMGVAATSVSDDSLEYVLRVPADDPDFCIYFSLVAQNEKSWLARIAALLLMHRDSRCERCCALTPARHSRSSRHPRSQLTHGLHSRASSFGRGRRHGRARQAGHSVAPWLPVTHAYDYQVRRIVTAFNGHGDIAHEDSSTFWLVG